MNIFQGWEDVIVKDLYDGRFDEIDLYVGLLFEEPTNDALVGPTNQCINVDQFIALKKGDPFFYTKGKLGNYNKDQINEIKRPNSLARITCSMAGVGNTFNRHRLKNTWTLPNPFGKQRLQSKKKCDLMGDFNFEPWKVTGWGEWEPTGQCSKTCGTGSQEFTRKCINGKPGDKGCEGQDRKIDDCNTQDCPFWGEWEKWSDCTKTCDTGTFTRVRHCVNGVPEQEGCKGKQAEFENCNTHSCLSDNECSIERSMMSKNTVANYIKNHPELKKIKSKLRK